MKKILVLTSTFPKNSQDQVPKFVYDQLDSIKNQYTNLEFLVLAPYIHDFQEIDGSISINQIRFHYFFLRKVEKLAGNGILPTVKKNWLYVLLVPFLIIGQIIATIRIIKEFKPDLLYAHWFFPQAFTTFIIKKLYGIPYVFTTHALDAWILKKIPILGSYIARKVILNSNAYTSDSIKAETSLHSFLKNTELIKKKSIVLPMPVSFNLKLGVSEKVAKVLNDKKFKNNYLLFIGRFVSKKGLDILFPIFKTVLLEKPNLKLVLAGSGKNEFYYRNLIKKLEIAKSVEFVGFVNSTEKKLLLDSARISIIPSIITNFGDEEGLPVVVLESLNSNTITLASLQSNSAEVIKNNINGYLFNPENLNKSSDLILEILNLDEVTKNKIILKANKISKEFLAINSSKLFYDHLFKNI